MEFLNDFYLTMNLYLTLTFFTHVYSSIMFGQNAARSTVPGGPSVACSTAKAVEWDAAWSKNLDPSGRAALGVHAAAYNESVDSKTANLRSGA